MDNKQFDALVRRLEPEAAASPRAYRWRVLVLALLGYAYIVGVVAVTLALAAASLWGMTHMRGNGAYHLGKLAAALLLLAGIIVRALWVRFDAPGGRRLTRAEAPALFEEAEALRRALDAPRASVVLLTDEYNAAVSQVPRLGILGFPRNYLIVGLPLLEALPADQVRAVLAHEFAHLSGAHGKLGNWIYRVRVTWFQLMQRLNERGPAGVLLFGKFFDWYAPYFGAYSFVLARQHEYEADRLAAQVVGRPLMAQMLVDLDVRQALLSERFWPGLWKGVEGSDAPPADVFDRLATTARAPLADGQARYWLATALKRRTDTDDTHPALRDRLAALVGAPDGTGRLPDGSALRPTLAFQAPAADHYLGASHASIAREISAGWRDAARPVWERRRQELREAREGLAALEAKAAAGPLDLEERWQRANWTEELKGSEAALPLYRALLAETPDHAPAAFAVGRLLLERGDEAGIGLIERTMEQDADAILPGCQVVYDFLAREGRLEEADRYREIATARAAMLEEAQHERQYMTTQDTYAPSELTAPDVALIVTQLDQLDGVRRAYLAKKIVKHFADEAPMHVLVIVPDRMRWSLDEEKKQRAVAEAIIAQLELPAGVSAFPLPEQTDHLLAPMRKVAGSLVYDAGKRKAERRARRGAREAQGTRAA